MPTDERSLARQPVVLIGYRRPARLVGLGGPIRLVHAGALSGDEVAAFHGRGRKDYAGGHDLEDLVAVVDGRPESSRKCRPTPISGDVSFEIRRLLGIQAFSTRLPGFLRPIARSGTIPAPAGRCARSSGRLASTPPPRGRGPRTPGLSLGPTKSSQPTQPRPIQRLMAAAMRCEARLVTAPAIGPVTRAVTNGGAS